ncbi:putative regulator of septum formation [Nocardiopsis sp. Huas11]|uniref:septum formation family protein n=1 Tax=Nocardiopsis sp. Huas11 TaxID=2183912 RepID=UPI000EB46587|nr:septum formation family protein [Nocardiopsis sp. Huas11]RKS10398.1 putative regulator of septum formation [Nocardiopsis sp. Huas11]
MPTETRRPFRGRTALGTLVAGAALSLTACGPLPLLPPGLGDGEETVSPEPGPEASQAAEPEPEARATISSAPEPEPSESATTGDGAESVGVFDLEEGDCINEVDQENDIVDVPMVDCSGPHDYEVYVSDELDEEGEFPGDQEVSDMTTALCHDEFEDFVGTPYLESELEFTSFFPTPTGWDLYDNREYLCLVYDPAGPVEGTLEDSER